MCISGAHRACWATQQVAMWPAKLASNSSCTSRTDTSTLCANRQVAGGPAGMSNESIMLDLAAGSLDLMSPGDGILSAASMFNPAIISATLSSEALVQRGQVCRSWMCHLTHLGRHLSAVARKMAVPRIHAVQIPNGRTMSLFHGHIAMYLGVTCMLNASRKQRQRILQGADGPHRLRTYLLHRIANHFAHASASS